MPEAETVIRPGFFDIGHSKPKKFHHYRTKMPMNSACELNLPSNAHMAFDAALTELFKSWGIQCGMQNHHAYEFENGVMILFNDMVIRIDHISSWDNKSLPSIDPKHCEGCEDDFYNGKNPLGVERCWKRSTAKLEMRRRVAGHERPPWERAPEELPSCYRQKDCIFVPPGVSR